MVRITRWRCVEPGQKGRLRIAAELAVVEGALGFWTAIAEVWPKTRGQRCWLHKTANVLNKLPKSRQSRA